MSSYAELNSQHKAARPLYLELRVLGLDLCAEEDVEDASGYRIAVWGLTSLSPAHGDRLVRRIEEFKPGLVRVMVDRWNADLCAIREEGTKT